MSVSKCPFCSSTLSLTKEGDLGDPVFGDQVLLKLLCQQLELPLDVNTLESPFDGFPSCPTCRNFYKYLYDLYEVCLQAKEQMKVVLKDFQKRIAISGQKDSNISHPQGSNINVQKLRSAILEKYAVRKPKTLTVNSVEDPISKTLSPNQYESPPNSPNPSVTDDVFYIQDFSDDSEEDSELESHVESSAKDKAAVPKPVSHLSAQTTPDQVSLKPSSSTTNYLKGNIKSAADKTNFQTGVNRRQGPPTEVNKDAVLQKSQPKSCPSPQTPVPSTISKSIITTALNCNSGSRKVEMSSEITSVQSLSDSTAFPTPTNDDTDHTNELLMSERKLTLRPTKTANNKGNDSNTTNTSIPRLEDCIKSTELEQRNPIKSSLSSDVRSPPTIQRKQPRLILPKGIPILVPVGNKSNPANPVTKKATLPPTPVTPSKDEPTLMSTRIKASPNIILIPITNNPLVPVPTRNRFKTPKVPDKSVGQFPVLTDKPISTLLSNQRTKSPAAIQSLNKPPTSSCSRPNVLSNINTRSTDNLKPFKLRLLNKSATATPCVSNQIKTPISSTKTISSTARDDQQLPPCVTVNDPTSGLKKKDEDAFLLQKKSVNISHDDEEPLSITDESNSSSFEHDNQNKRKFIKDPDADGSQSLHLTQTEDPLLNLERRDRTCDVCWKRIPSTTLTCFLQHLLRHENGEKNDGPPRLKSKECPKCQKTYLSAFLLNRHIELHRDVHANLYICGICDEGFKWLADFKKHEQKSPLHKVDKPEDRNCRVCKLNLSPLRDLRRHEYIMHPELGIHQCYLCSSDFVSEAFLETHLITHSAGPYKCTCCNQESLESGDLLQQHLLLEHTGVNEKSKGVPRNNLKRPAMSPCNSTHNSGIKLFKESDTARKEIRLPSGGVPSSKPLNVSEKEVQIPSTDALMKQLDGQETVQIQRPKVRSRKQTLTPISSNLSTEPEFCEIEPECPAETTSEDISFPKPSTSPTKNTGMPTIFQKCAAGLQIKTLIRGSQFQNNSAILQLQERNRHKSAKEMLMELDKDQNSARVDHRTGIIIANCGKRYNEVETDLEGSKTMVPVQLCNLLRLPSITEIKSKPIEWWSRLQVETVKSLQLERSPEGKENSKFVLQLLRQEKDAKDKCLNCPICQKKYFSNFLFVRHIQFHILYVDRLYACDFCDLRFHKEDKTGFLEHLTQSRYHKLENKCRICHRSFTSAKEVGRHEHLNHPELQTHQCKICQQTFALESYLDIHLKTHSINLNDKFTCSYCSKKRFPSIEALRNHLSLHVRLGENEVEYALLRQQLKSEYVCEICSKCIQPAYFNNVVRHLLNHESEVTEKPFKCSTCEKEFASKFLLLRHIHLHKSEKTRPLICEICDARYSNDKELERHKQISQLHRKNSGPKVGSFECTICQKKLHGRVNLRRHEYLQHPELRTHECTMCDQTFVSQTFLETHLKTHSPTGPYYCSCCHLISSSGELLSKHLQSHLGLGEPKRLKNKPQPYQNTLTGYVNASVPKTGFPCACGRRFHKLSGLKTHKRTCRGAGPATCEICSKKFGNRHLLMNHYTYVHQRRRDYLCDLCGKAFPAPSRLRLHMKTHEDKRNWEFVCYFCNKRFCNWFNLKTHMPSHTIEKCHQCTRCGARFLFSRQLTAHSKKSLCRPTDNLTNTGSSASVFSIATSPSFVDLTTDDSSPLLN